MGVYLADTGSAQPCICQDTLKAQASHQGPKTNVQKDATDRQGQMGSERISTTLLGPDKDHQQNHNRRRKTISKTKP